MIGSLDLTPSFSSGVKTYTAATDQDTATITVNPTDATATTTIKLNNEVVSDGELIFDEGSNTVEITVVNDSVTETYTIAVTYTPESK